MTAPRVLVLGATGKTGSLVARGLAARGLAVRTASRGDAPGDHVRFDWAEPGTHEAALAGVTRAYLVAPALVDDPARLMLPFVARALGRGVRRLVLLGSSAIPEGAPGLGAVARALREQAPEWAVLRPSWFMQNFVDPHHGHGASLLRDGQIVTSTGDGRVGFVDVADIAAVAVHALADERSHDAAHVITGPEALNHDEVAEIAGRALGRPVRHVRVDDETARRRLVELGMPRAYAELLVGLDIAIRGGAEARVTDTVERVTGRAPRSFAAFMAAWCAARG